MNWRPRFNRRKDRTPEVRTGACFRSSVRHGVVATARVLGITPDAHGIEHVRFFLEVEPASFGWSGDQRTLTLSSFLEAYPEPLQAGG